MLIKSHVLNRIYYCSILLVNAPANQLNRLQSILHKSIRFANSLQRRDSVTSYLKEAHFLPVKFRIKYKSCVFVYNMLHGSCPAYMDNVVVPKIPQERNLQTATIYCFIKHLIQVLCSMGWFRIGTVCHTLFVVLLNQTYSKNIWKHIISI